MKDVLQNQFEYLRKLKKLPEMRLRKLHKNIFRNSRFFVKIPRWMHRSIIERRLFYYYAANNYHYPKDHAFTREFRRKAKHILSEEYLGTIDPKEDAKQRIKDLAQFNGPNIRAMSIVEVDRYLASLGLFIDADEDLRRQALYEWFNSKPVNLVQHHNSDNRLVRAHRKGNLNNKFYLRDLILDNPTLSFSEFRERYGEQMPTVTRESYNVQRCLLRKSGYSIPFLPRGPSNPTVRRGPQGFSQKARTLNKDIEEESFDG